MQEFNYVVYVNEEIASSTTHEAINRKRVYLCKPVTYFRGRKVGRIQNELSVSTHQRVENLTPQLR